MNYTTKIFSYMGRSIDFLKEEHNWNIIIKGCIHCRERGIKRIMRIDKFLKVSRIIKRRSVANQACSSGAVRINGKEASPEAGLPPAI